MPNSTFRFLLTLALLGLSLAPAEARRGYVRVRDGRVMEGHLGFDSNAVIVANAAQELWVRIALTNVDALGFDEEFTSTSAETTPARLSWPWRHEDIGSAIRPGDADAVGGYMRVRSSGTNVLGDGDSFHFVHKVVTGETELIARMARIQCMDPWATAGLMLRESLAADARHVFLALTPARGGQLATRERARGETSVELLPATGPSNWLKLRRDADGITAWRSRDGQNWTSVGRYLGVWPEELYVGLAVTGGRQGMSNLAIFEHVEEAPSVRNRFFVPQIELLSGSTQVGYVSSLDETSLHFEGYNRPSVSTLRVATIRFQTVPSKLAPRLMDGRPGVLLKTGEFIEGECRRIDHARVTVNSVPLGVRRYDVNNDVIAVVLARRPLLSPRTYEVRTLDGALWLAQDVTLDSDGLLLHEPQLGQRRIAWHEILQFRRAS